MLDSHSWASLGAIAARAGLPVGTVRGAFSCAHNAYEVELEAPNGRHAPPMPSGPEQQAVRTLVARCQELRQRDQAAARQSYDVMRSLMNDRQRSADEVAFLLVRVLMDRAQKRARTYTVVLDLVGELERRSLSPRAYGLPDFITASNLLRRAVALYSSCNQAMAAQAQQAEQQAPTAKSIGGE